VVVGAMSAYLTLSGAVGPWSGRWVGAAGLDGADCADATMAAVTLRTPDSAQAAYHCLAPRFQQTVSEQQFTSQLGSTPALADARVSRVGTHAMANGTTLVYYALESRTESVGYIIYLDANGRVADID
jgi:hypothetical protein